MPKFKYYKSPDTLPIFNFYKCKDGELQYLYKCDIDELPETFPEEFNNIFLNIMYELNHLDLNVMRLIYKVAKYKNLYLTTLDKKYLNKANLTEAEYKRQMSISNEVKFDFMEQVSKVEEYLSRKSGVDRKIDMYKCSTSKYFGYLEQLRNDG